MLGGRTSARPIPVRRCALQRRRKRLEAAGRPASPHMTRLRKGVQLLVRRVLPWIVALGILGFLVHRAGGSALRDAVREANLTVLIGATIVCTLGMFLLDALALSRVVSWFNCPTSAREIAPVKAAAYLINVVNYNAGSGAIALWLARHKGIPFLESAASVLFINVVDALVLVALMAVAWPWLEPPIAPAVAAIIGVAVLAFAGNLLYWRRGMNFFFLGRMRGWPIFKSFREARVSHYARLAAIRVPFDLFFILNHWFGLVAFGIQVPVIKVLAFIPVISFIGIVPVTVAGLGTVQAATVFLFRPYAPEARILAFSLVLTVALNGIRALLGVFTFQRVSEDVMRGGAPAENVS